jgi:predicted nucleotidyltransferase
MENTNQISYIVVMRRDDAIARLKQTEPALRAFGVAALYLFGSHARDEAQSDSDVDVFVDVAPDTKFGLRPYMGVFRVLEDAFDHQAEIGYSTRDALSPYIRVDVERDALRIF